MSELRLYALGIGEVRGMVGASQGEQDRLRAVAARVLAPPAPTGGRGGLLGKLGPIFRRAPDAPVVPPTQPTPADVDVLLAGTHVPPDRVGATWRLLECLVAAEAWGSTRVELGPDALDQLDFALARGGVPASLGLRHLLSCSPGLPLAPVEGLVAGWHPHETALAMAGAYRVALTSVPDRTRAELVAALVGWLDGLLPWAQVAARQNRPAPDLVGFLAR